ncbi:putative F-box protein At3g58860 [Spinacia oleracea]|uniref:F-box protein At3g58860 n=1 Tax=Spinacia oleracea TaxID=3562 RepID=A0A9R0JGB9_SPIOL|nr:putative F-box protein At3g58860 [Spinacia oleracea]
MRGYVSSKKKRCSSEKVQSSSTGVLERCKVADRLSELPDDIIVSVLSRLKLKEATRTSVLSRRWRSLWTFTTGALDFHYAGPVPDGPQAADIYLDIYLHGRKNKDPLVERGRPEFIAWVNHVLSLHQGSRIDEFEVSAKLFGRMRTSIIDKWLHFAFQKRVKRLKLDLRRKIPTSETSYSLKKPLLCKFSSHLDSLTLLYLNEVAVSSKVIHYFLLKCCFLEELHVERSSCLVEMKVPGPMPQLRCLRIIDCLNLKFIEIHAVNILVFAYHGYNVPVTFGKAPPLVDASLGGYYASYLVKNMSQFPSYISSVESLQLDLSGYHLSAGVLPDLPTFENLVDLKLMLQGFGVGSTLDCCASLFKRCPILRRFSLNVSLRNGTERAEDRKRIKRSTECLHSLINVLELEGFGGSEGRAEVDCSIVSCLPSLEQVILRPSFAMLYDKVEIKEKVADLSKHLKMIMPLRAELIVYDNVYYTPN